MTQGPQQIAVVGDGRGEIVEQGERTSISPDELREMFVEIKCENCGEAGTYQGDLVSEGNQQFHSNFSSDCTECGHHLEATVSLQEDPTAGGLNVVGFEPPEGGTYNHDPYFANKIEDVDEEGTPTGSPR